MEKPRDTMNTSENNCYAGANRKGERIMGFGTVKGRDAERRGLLEGVACGETTEGHEEGEEWMEHEYINNTKQNRLFFLFLLDESREVLHLGENGSWGCGKI